MSSPNDSQLYWLECTSGLRVPVCGHVSIGRSRTNTISVNSEKASRRHALVHQDEEGNCIIIDLGSSNGTYVNGKRIAHLSQLKTGDTIDVGSERFILTAETQSAESESKQVAAAEAQLEPCWILVAGKDTSQTESVQDETDDTYKTIINWAQVCDMILERNKAAVAIAPEGAVIGYWHDRDPSVSAQVVKAVRELKVTQARQRMEFRYALHYGMVVIGRADLSRRKSLIGTEATFALKLQRQAWELAVPCLISDEANWRLRSLLETHPTGARADDRQLFTL